METIEFKFGDFKSQVILKRRFSIPNLKVKEYPKRLFIYDTNTASIFGEGVKDLLVLPGGEKNKSWLSISSIQNKAIENGLSRDSVLIGVGGGIVCDVTAFAASIFMRGCNLVLIPTTLLAMVDAAIGGKTGINLGGYKNMIGTFYPAREIHVCMSALQFLPEREYRLGLAEVIKTAMIGDSKLFHILISERERILKKDLKLIEEVIKRCILVKGRIVEKDFREEKGERAFLNLGHTFGHALETVSAFKGWSHGEAVAWGIAKTMDLGVKLGITSVSYAKSVKNLLIEYGFRIKAKEIKPELIIKAMMKDKKRLKGVLRFVLQEDLCETRLVELDESHLMHLTGVIS